jgi:Tlde1 domain
MFLPQTSGDVRCRGRCARGDVQWEWGKVLVRLGGRTIPFGIAAVSLGFLLNSAVTQAGPAYAGLPGPGISVFGTIHPDIFRFRPPLGSGPPADGVRVASLDPQVGLDCQDRCRRASLAERFAALHDRPASFDERFASANPVSSDERFGSIMRVRTASLRLPPGQEVQKQRADAPPTRIVSTAHVHPDQRRKDVGSPVDDGRTAIYDITAHTVYLPGGRRLEAHSGLGDFMDNPRHVHVRMRGSTPPNVYNLAFRERLFHGVRAVRLKPVDDTRMYGRGGILAHTYMLGPNGQSNGCVSFRNYPEFLNAFQKGEVTRLAVVERLESPPGRLAAGQLPESVRDLLNATDRSRHYAAAGNN